MFEIREIKNESEYRPLSISESAPFTQAWFFGNWQEKMGRKARRFEIKSGAETVGFFQTIKYPLFKIGDFSKNILYIPHGPVAGKGDFSKKLREKLLDIAEEENAVLVRFDSEGEFDKSNFKKVPARAYRASYFQPKHEWVLDLNKPEEELFLEMNPKNQYNVNLAKRKGIEVEIIRSDFFGYFENFHELLRQTAARNKFSLHPRAYYQNIFSSLKGNSAFLAVARGGGKVLAINLILIYGDAAYFLFGGSSDEMKNLMFSHLAQWEIIREAKNRGVRIYNFGGIDVDRNGKLGGVSFFKKRFGGRVLERPDSYDLAREPFWHHLYNFKKRFF